MMKHKKKMLGLQLFMFMGILVMLYYGFSTADSGLSREDAQRAKEAIQKAALECYSIEGAYPQSLEYLKQHYGLYIQEDAYAHPLSLHRGKYHAGYGCVSKE